MEQNDEEEKKKEKKKKEYMARDQITFSSANDIQKRINVKLK